MDGVPAILWTLMLVAGFFAVMWLVLCVLKKFL